MLQALDLSTLNLEILSNQAMTSMTETLWVSYERTSKVVSRFLQATRKLFVPSGVAEEELELEAAETAESIRSEYSSVPSSTKNFQFCYQMAASGYE